MSNSDQLKMHSPNLVDANIEKIAVLFPNCVTEVEAENGELKKTIDFDLLKQELSQVIVEGEQERYRLDWVGKKESILTANAPIAKTLRPCREESVNFDTTENLFIEGDNLEALKLLQENYLGKVKMIYIDPPYNTGNDFIYEDDFAESTDEFFERSNQVDEDGNRLIANTDSNGRFHSDWLSMMYSRLKLARNLLSDQGVLFCSIGEVEVDSLAKLIKEIFGENNFLTIIPRLMKTGGAKGKFFSPSVDYILVCTKNIESTLPFRAPLTEEQIQIFYNKKEIEGKRKGELFGEERLFKASLDARPNQRYWIECPDGSFCIPPGNKFPKKLIQGEKVLPSSDDKVWKWIYPRFKEEFDKGNIVFKETATSGLVDQDGKQSKWNIYNKVWLLDQQEKGVVPSNYLNKFENRQSSAELKKLEIPFDFAKPTSLLIYLTQICRLKDQDIVLDFFAGSGSFADAIMQLSIKESKKLKYILVQIPQESMDDSEEYKLGYKNIAEISKERIRRAGKKIIEDNASTEGIENLDIGFRVLKIDSTNMKDVYYTPDSYKQVDILDLADHIKEDRTSEDLLFQVMLDWGLELSLPIERKTIQGKEVFYVAGNSLVACFDEINFAMVDEIAQDKPLRVVSAERAIQLDHDKTNVKERFKQLSPETEIKFI
ncbi:site-specific DNA-methyltransferase [Acinetobacter sp. TAC-1]|uniref:site-specific DNA-methyltransferase n=1 Tax=Acinetobacter sp. TAC-1 TaxID=3027470 RepID=UPI0023AB2316|nr:site-specific DNA-methyltransferase [Acinetobacter sp. TAC-1]WEE39352.1 site-specific DNA-methyltransferase [Acinetobacter sp. TAC-1]